MLLISIISSYHWNGGVQENATNLQQVFTHESTDVTTTMCGEYSVSVHTYTSACINASSAISCYKYTDGIAYTWFTIIYRTIISACVYVWQTKGDLCIYHQVLPSSKNIESYRICIAIILPFWNKASLLAGWVYMYTPNNRAYTAWLN